MPINPELRALYPPDRVAISARIRFERAGGRCEACGRPHMRLIFVLPDGSWRVAGGEIDWRNGRGERIPSPVVRMGDRPRIVRVVLSCAHRDHWPPNVDDANLAAWCGRCHLIHDAPHHRASRRMRWALGDLFLGPYPAPLSRIHDTLL